MSTTTAALTVAVILVVCFPVAWWQIRRAMRHDTASARIQADSGLWDGPSVAPDIRRHTDPRWGTDAALLDECSLLLPEFAPGTDRLLQTIHDDDTTKGDQQ